jgi:protein TonB
MVVDASVTLLLPLPASDELPECEPVLEPDEEPECEPDDDPEPDPDSLPLPVPLPPPSSLVDESSPEIVGLLLAHPATTTVPPSAAQTKKAQGEANDPSRILPSSNERDPKG